MFRGYDFIYDGISSSSKNVKLLYVDEDSYNTSQGIPAKEYNLIKGFHSNNWKISGITIDNPLEFSLNIVIHDEMYHNAPNQKIKRNLITSISNWLFNKTTFKKLQIIQDGMEDYYYMAIFQSPEYIYFEGEIIGFKATVTCDTFGAYQDKTIIKTCTNTLSFKEYCTHDGEYEITPKFKIESNSSEFSVSINGKEMKFKNMSTPCTVDVDSKTFIIKTDFDDVFNGDKFNLTYPLMKDGVNNIVINGDCKVTIKYSQIREVGG